MTEAGLISDSPLADVQIHLVESLDDAWAMKRWLGERREVLGVDVESTGFSPWHGHLRLIQLGDLKHGWVCPAGGKRSWAGAAMECIESWPGDYAYHNAPFDLKWLAVHEGYVNPPWERIHNTMTLAHLLDPSRPRGLKPLGDKLVDPRASAGQAILNDGMKKQGWTFETVPLDFPPYWIYAGLDPVITAHVYSKCAPEVASQFQVPYDIERAADRICTGMMMHGALIDVEWVQKAIAWITAHAVNVRAWLKEYHGITSPLSGGQISRAMERLGVPVLMRTSAGAPQLDKAALEMYSHMFPGPCAELMTALRDVRQAEKVTGTYLRNFLEMRDGNDRLHPSLWVCEAKTSRMTCSDPNLQNLNRDNRAVRGSIIPAEGCWLISFDADQIEARLAAHFSEDPGLIEAFRIADETGIDFFVTIAQEIYQDPSITKKDPRRQITKNTMYGKQFGAGTEKMALTAGIPTEQMAVVHAALNLRYPGLNELMDRTVREGRNQLYEGRPAVYLPTGRRLLATPGKEYTLANFRIQGHAAEILKLGAARLEAQGLGPYMVMPVHDEIILEVPIHEAEEILKIGAEILTDRTNYLVPITWSGEIMKDRWVKT